MLKGFSQSFCLLISLESLLSVEFLLSNIRSLTATFFCNISVQFPISDYFENFNTVMFPWWGYRFHVFSYWKEICVRYTFWQRLTILIGEKLCFTQLKEWLLGCFWPFSCMFTLWIKFYAFHYYILRVQMFEKCDSSNRQ